MKRTQILSWLLLSVFSASALAQTEITEKTPCPVSFAEINLEPSEANLPVVYGMKKGLLPPDFEETKAILKDTMGPIQIFFPVGYSGDELSSLYYQEAPWRESFKHRKWDYGDISNAISGLDPATRRDELKRYVTSVLDYFSNKPSELSQLRGKPTQAQIDATLARIKRLQEDPHQRELLLEALDSQFQERVTQLETTDLYFMTDIRKAQVCGAFVASCAAVFFHYHGAPSDSFATIAGGVLGIFGATFSGLATGIDLLSRSGTIRQKLFKRASERAFERYMTEAGAEGRREWPWYKWKFARQKIAEDEKRATTPEDVITAQGFHLLNVSEFLHSLSVEELPNGKRFSEVFKGKKRIPEKDLQELLQATDRRLKQLEVVKSDVAQMQANVATAKATDSPALNQVLAVQVQSSRQLAVSADMATTHLKNIRNLVQLTEADQSNAEKLAAELEEFKNSIGGEK